jgi:hypothetical protein
VGTVEFHLMRGRGRAGTGTGITIISTAYSDPLCLWVTIIMRSIAVPPNGAVHLRPFGGSHMQMRGNHWGQEG